MTKSPKGGQLIGETCMIKIKTLFKKDPNNLARVTTEIIYTLIHK